MDRSIVRDRASLEPVPWNRSRAPVLVVPAVSGYILITYLHSRHDHGHEAVEVVERRSKSTGREALLSVGTDYRSLALERNAFETCARTHDEREARDINAKMDNSDESESMKLLPFQEISCETTETVGSPSRFETEVSR